MAIYLKFSEPGNQMTTFEVPLQEDFWVLRLEKTDQAGAFQQLRTLGVAQDAFFLKDDDRSAYIFIRKNQFRDLNWNLLSVNFTWSLASGNLVFKVISSNLSCWPSARKRFEGSAAGFSAYCLQKFTPWVDVLSPEWRAFEAVVDSARSTGPNLFASPKKRAAEQDLAADRQVVQAASILCELKSSKRPRLR